MSRNKQIKEMAKAIADKTTLSIIEATGVAEILAVEDYRKSFEVVEEIFAEIDKALDDSVETEHFKGTWFNFSKFKQRLAELKKKHREGRK